MPHAPDDFQQTLLSLAPGEMLCNRYRLVRELGRGGMGVVWLAEDTQLADRPVAVKVLPTVLSRNARAITRLKQEATTNLELTHPHIVRLHTFEQDHSRNDTAFLVMQYIQGKTLDDMLADHPKGIAVQRVRKWAEQIAGAVDFAHQKNILHRDIKPSNIIIDSNDDAYLMDFGIAREAKDTFTRVTGQDSSGTLPYMSPQQLDGENKKSNDIYSLGATLYEAFKGDPPFTTGDLYQQIKHRPVLEIEHIPPAINSALLAAMAKNPDERPETARQLVARFADSHPIRPTRQSPANTPANTPAKTPAKARAKRSPVPAVIGALVLVGVLVGVWWVAASQPTGSAPPSEAPALAWSEPQPNLATLQSPDAGAPAVSVNAAAQTEAAPTTSAPPREPTPTRSTRATRARFSSAADLLDIELELDRLRRVEIDESLHPSIAEAMSDARAITESAASNKQLGEWAAAGQAYERARDNYRIAHERHALARSAVEARAAYQAIERPSVWRELQELRSAVQSYESEVRDADRALGEGRFEAARSGYERAAQHLRRALDLNRITPGSRAGERRVITLPGTNVEMAFRWCPPGQFVMGSPPNEAGRFENEGPQRTVRFARGFWLGETPVTQAQWRAVMGNNPSRFKGDDRPVESVSWNDAQEFIKKLRERGLQVRLPSEAEWEYACRAGSTTRFHFGDDESRLGEYAWFRANSNSSTQPVGRKKPNNWVLFDMHGNVWEWCQDVWHANYQGAPTDGSAWVAGGDQSRRVLRGGRWVSNPQYCRSADRLRDTPGSRTGNDGFRLALDSF